MAEECGDNKYIKCSKCKCKYINDDKHIKNDFGYNRLEERFKTCTKCRTKTNKKVNLNTLPDELTNKIIMMSIPTYSFMDELKTTRIIRTVCNCEGCTEKHYYGCYYCDFNYRLKPTEQIMTLNSV